MSLCHFTQLLYFVNDIIQKLLSYCCHYVILHLTVWYNGSTDNEKRPGSSSNSKVELLHASCGSQDPAAWRNRRIREKHRWSHVEAKYIPAKYSLTFTYYTSFYTPCSYSRYTVILIWLVVDLPLWKMMEFVTWDYCILPNIWKKKHVPNHLLSIGFSIIPFGKLT